MFPIQVLRLRAGVPITLVNIFNTTATRNTVSPTPATATYQLAASGTGSRTLSGGGNSTWTWLLYGLNSDYQVRATLVSGTNPSGSAVGSWLGLGVDRSWSLTQSGLGNDTCSLTIEIRKVVDSTIIATATITINVGVN